MAKTEDGRDIIEADSVPLSAVILCVQVFQEMVANDTIATSVYGQPLSREEALGVVEQIQNFSYKATDI